jgi:hypothetical protein
VRIVLDPDDRTVGRRPGQDGADCPACPRQRHQDQKTLKDTWLAPCVSARLVAQMWDGRVIRRSKNPFVWAMLRRPNFAAQWPARMCPYGRFALVLANDDARLGASAVRYSFTVGLLHSFQLAGFDRRTGFLDTTGRRGCMVLRGG